MLGLYTFLSLLGVLALVALNWWLGRDGRLSKPKIPARERIGLDLIDFVEREGEAANAGDAYIALGARDDDIAFAVLMGDGWVVRRINGLEGLNHDGASLDLMMKDFTFPQIKLTFENDERALLWHQRLSALAKAQVKAQDHGLAEAS